jgi:hypothetical protein
MSALSYSRGLFVLLASPFAFAGTIFSVPAPEYIAATTVVSFADPDEALIGSISDGTETILFSSVTSLMRASTVGDDWGTWGSPPNTESSMPRVLWSGQDDNFDSVTTVTFLLSAPVSIFGFEAEPGLFDTYTMVATFYMGGTLEQTISRDVIGNAGALLFAAQAPAGQFFDSVTFTSDVDWAAGQFRYALAPEPEAVAMILVGLSVLVALSRKFKGIK